MVKNYFTEIYKIRFNNYLINYLLFIIIQMMMIIKIVLQHKIWKFCIGMDVEKCL